jgi:hypothetical protein
MEIGAVRPTKTVMVNHLSCKVHAANIKPTENALEKNLEKSAAIIKRVSTIVPCIRILCILVDEKWFYGVDQS